jgi:uncharacterized protein (UPF0548 family)
VNDRRREPAALAARSLTYGAVGATRPGDDLWNARPPGYRAYERTVRIGEGVAVWESAASAVLEWGIKTRSGFAVEGESGGARRVEAGANYWLLAAVGPFPVREPARVVAVVDRPDRCGFAYGTLEGHPLSGEEAFVVHRSPDGVVWLTLRSISRSAAGRWRLALPGILIAQRWYRFRYLHALR